MVTLGRLMRSCGDGYLYCSESHYLDRVPLAGERPEAVSLTAPFLINRIENFHLHLCPNKSPPAHRHASTALPLPCPTTPIILPS